MRCKKKRGATLVDREKDLNQSLLRELVHVVLGACLFISFLGSLGLLLLLLSVSGS